jgi:hypothetical protein
MENKCQNNNFKHGQRCKRTIDESIMRHESMDSNELVESHVRYILVWDDDKFSDYFKKNEYCESCTIELENPGYCSVM